MEVILQSLNIQGKWHVCERLAMIGIVDSLKNKR